MQTFTAGKPDLPPVHRNRVDAGEVIPAATLAVKHQLTVADLVGTLFPYVTYAEALRLAAVSFDKDLDKRSCCV
jgi:mercuric reductase